jgi:SpoIVB peptidase S55
MKKAVVLLFAVVLLLVFSASAQNTPAVKTLPVDQIKAGMKGVAYTVFEGTQPDQMQIEVVGVLKGVVGPKGDLILVRLGGAKAEYTGVAAGMSGSPVYIDGKLVGAISYRIPAAFAREPIAGVTPIANMLEIDEMDRTVPAEAAAARMKQENQRSAMSGGNPESAADLQSYASLLKPIEAPFVFSGFNEEALKLFAPKLAAAGIAPVSGVGSVTDEKQPEPLVPGSAVSAILVHGDMDIAATCTVTYLDPEHLLACGHPLLQYGAVDMPMTKANVLATLSSPLNQFKIVNATETVGRFVQDRHFGILGHFGQPAEMIPVTVSVHGGSRPKTFHFEVLNNARLTPVFMMLTVFNALQGVNDYGEETTYRMQGKISVHGYPDVALQNMYAPMDANIPTGFLVAVSLGDHFGRIYDNPFIKPNISGVQLDFDLVHDRRSARLESVRTDVTEARPGEEIVVEAMLRPYRGEPIVRQIPVRIPTSTPKGPLRILVSDGDTLDRMRHVGPALGNKLDLRSVIALLNKEHANHRLYVSLLEANPEAMVEDKVMPALPLSVMNVMEGMRGTQDMVVTGESSVNESSTPLDYVVSGAQVLTVTVK